MNFCACLDDEITVVEAFAAFFQTLRRFFNFPISVIVELITS